MDEINNSSHSPKYGATLHYKYFVALSKRGKLSRTPILWFNLNSPATNLSIGVGSQETPFPAPFHHFLFVVVYAGIPPSIALRLTPGKKKSGINNWLVRKLLII